MKKITYLLVPVCALAAAACNSDNIGTTYSGENEVATFAQSIIKDSEVDIEATEYFVPVRRQTNTGELTVNLTANPYQGKIKAPVTSVTFADGEYETTLKIDVTDIVLGETDTLGLKLTNCLDKHISVDSCAVILARGYTWVSLGEGQWYDAFIDAAVTPVQVSKADGFEVYRVYAPYPQDVLVEAGYETSGAWGCGGAACEYIEFSVDGEGYIAWQTWSTTIDYSGNGNTIYAYYVPTVDPKCYGILTEDNVAVFYPYYYIPGVGGWGVVAYCALSLPGGPDLEEWLSE